MNEKLGQSEMLIGSPSLEAVKRIFEFHRGSIKKGSLILYQLSLGEPARKELLRINFSPNEAVFLEDLIKENLRPDHEIGISSRVEFLDGYSGHIPMLDLRCPVDSLNQAKVERRLARLSLVEGEPGERPEWAVSDSGNSYQIKCLNSLLRVTRSNSEDILWFAEKCHPVLDFNLDGEYDRLISAWYFIHRASGGEMVMRLTNNY